MHYLQDKYIASNSELPHLKEGVFSLKVINNFLLNECPEHTVSSPYVSDLSSIGDRNLYIIRFDDERILESGILEEGLIKTYPAEKTISMHMTTYHLQQLLMWRI